MKLVAKEVNKKLNGRDILLNINVELEQGRVYGFVGRNGSGKTMLFRALSGLMRIDNGEISYGEKILHKDMSILPDLGIILDKVGLYPDMSGFANLRLLAKIKGVASDSDIATAIQRVGLDPKDKRTYRKYSLGMKQRIVIAQAIMEKPSVLMLDEPTNALDQSGVEMIREIIKQEKERGATILLASHNKEDITLLADEVFYMENGKIIEVGEMKT